jgi:hypothetical protein
MINEEQRKIGENVDSKTGSVLDLKELAKSPYGNLEITKYLYESGLQNIFNTYQQNVATLSQNKKTELQDAYYIREMSKKYLGEYASNVGIGDVSGNLLDIYGQYQSNITDIQKNYGQLEIGLQEQYQQKRMETMNNLLLTDYNIEVAKLAEADRNVLFNIEMGNTGDLTDQEYLEQEYQAGRITKETYQIASMNIMDNARTAEERELWGRIVRGEVSKEELTTQYEEGKISPEAYNTYFSAIKKEERQQVLSGIEYNLIQNNTNGLTTDQYLEQQLENGIINQEEYQNFMLKYSTSSQTKKAKDIIQYQADLSSGKFGGRTFDEYINYGLDSGLLTPEQALSEVLKNRSAADQKALQEAYEAAQQSENPQNTLDEFVQNGTITEQGKEFIEKLIEEELKTKVETSQTTFFGTDAQFMTFDEQGRTIFKDNPYLDTVVKYGLNKNAGYLLQNNDPAVTEQSKIVFYGQGGVEPSEYIVAGLDVSVDPYFEGFLETPTYSTLSKFNDVNTLRSGQIYQFQDGQNYLYENNKLFRLIESNTTNIVSNLTDENMKMIGAPEAKSSLLSSDNITKSGDINGVPWEYKTNGKGTDTLMFNGVMYEEDIRRNQFSTGKTEEQKAVIERFKQVHGDKKSVVIFFNGTFWNRDVNGNYQKMIKK